MSYLEELMLQSISKNGDIQMKHTINDHFSNENLTNQSFQSENSQSSQLPDKIDTAKVIEMIRNADLYDLINISLKQKELKNDQVEQFIQKALQKSSSK